jgi:hypothetical protein
MREFIGSTKGKVCLLAVIALIVAGAVLAVTLNKDDYRSISVEETTGEVTVVGNKSNGNAYVGQHLYSGDDVTVSSSSELTMCMDTDKYMYAEENTHFTLQASAGSEDSKIKIYMDEGSTLHKLESKLGENDIYEVDTPNSTMSVRGTTFRVTVYKEANDIYTLTEVTDGEVNVKLKKADGTYSGEEKNVAAGESVLIRSTADESEFVVEEPEPEEPVTVEEEPTPTPEPESEIESESEERSEETSSEPVSESVAEDTTQTVAAPASDVEAIIAYASSLGYNVRIYQASLDNATIFQCTYNATTTGKVFRSEAQSRADNTENAIRTVLVDFKTSDYVTVNSEAASLNDYMDFNNPIVPIVARRNFVNLETTYQLLQEVKTYY